MDCMHPSVVAEMELLSAQLVPMTCSTCCGCTGQDFLPTLLRVWFTVALGLLVGGLAFSLAVCNESLATAAGVPKKKKKGFLPAQPAKTPGYRSQFGVAPVSARAAC